MPAGQAADAGTEARHDRTPDQVLMALRTFSGDLLLDLDETVYLRNSTEDFIDSAAPGLPVLVGLRLLDLLRPWRWSGTLEARDWWRVRLTMLLCPWIGLLWRRRVGSLGKHHANGPLIDAVRASKARALVLTNGFDAIVRPLLAAMGLSDLPLIACSLRGPRDRTRGKLALVTRSLGADRIGSAMVVTDSLNDLPLLDRSGSPFRTLWPGAAFHHALHRVYLPGMYLTEVKRPGQRYVLNGILTEDFALWVLATIFVAAMPATHFAGLGLLLISFWTIYERGYVDNDEIGAKHEQTPYFSPRYGHVSVATPALQPWLWAAACGAAGIVLIRFPERGSLVDLLRWSAVLVTTHASFWIYNRMDKITRVLIYPWMQIARSAAFVAVLPLALPAALAVAAHVLARWLPYHVYRAADLRKWPETSVFLYRLVFFTILMAVAALVEPRQEMLTTTAAALLLWNIWQARRELRDTLRNGHRIDR